MGVIPTLLNMYARNARYRSQRKAYEQQKAEHKQEQARNDALSTLQRQQDQMQRTFIQNQNNNDFDPFGTFKKNFPE